MRTVYYCLSRGLLEDDRDVSRELVVVRNNDRDYYFHHHLGPSFLTTHLILV